MYFCSVQNYQAALKPLTRVVGFFYAYLSTINKPMGLGCAVAVMPARTCIVVLNNTASLFCLTFKNTIQ